MKKIKIIIVFCAILFTSVKIFSQTGGIQGKITDAATQEELIGASIIVQGTTKGTIADFEGNYILDGLSAGTYNIVFGFISYDQQIVKCEIKPGETIAVNISLHPATVGLEEVVVKKARRTNTEISLITELKSKEGIVSGISAEQISKTQDKDAAEVVRRVPGITITNGKFVIVRGLSQRYNSVLLNGVIAPSFETDVKAFSLDVLPSNMIENILIYKSPAPELPADFAGAVINIITKQNADKNEFKLSYSTGYKENASFNSDYQKYQGGKFDWLGFDDGTRALPKSVPSYDEFKQLYEWKDKDDYLTKMSQVVDISKDFNNNWTTRNHTPIPDQSFTATLQRRFTLGNASFGNITSLNYKNEYNYFVAQRTEYENYNDTLQEATYDFNYTDQRSVNTANIGLIHNWIMIFGNNQKIEFRNFFNNMGESSSSLRSGDYTYNSENSMLTNLRYRQRSIYSGQLAGKHAIGRSATSVDWLLGYSLTNNIDPDNRILKYSREINTEDPFVMKVDKEVNVFNGGRRFQDLNENVLSGSVNLVSALFQHIINFPVTVKTGLYYEKKHRQFNSELYGIIAPRGTQALDLNLYQLPGDLLITDNFFIDESNINRTGFAYKDGSRPSDSYQINNEITAAYLGVKLPVTRFVDIYGGLRTEKLDRLTYDFYEQASMADSVDVVTDTITLFPSVNLTVKLTEKHVLRFTYGKTVNRPEFRELSPAAYYDFDLNAIVHGNPALKDAFIENFDARYEWYPNPGEMISFAAFYKKFTNPIEVFLIPAGTGYDYSPFNVEKAFSKGLELDIRKRLLFFENLTGPFSYLKDLTIIANASVIKSEITTNLPFAREQKRVMQGQSPYIVNFGLYYDNSKSGTKVNVSYNKIGERIAYAGTPTNPHTWELPRNTVDLNFSQAIGKFIEISFGVKDLMNDKVRFVQYYGNDESVELPTMVYTPNRKFTAGISVIF